MSTMPPMDDTIRETGSCSQRDQAYHRLRRLLILQQTPEGKRLREAEWAEKLGVNRTALREAFARLEAEGLIEKGHVTGYFVPELTREDILEISEVRVMLEGGAIERICRLGLNTPRGLKILRQACEQLERLLQEAYYLGVAEADRRFHEGLIQAAGSKRLVMLYERAPLPMIPPDIVSGAEWTNTVHRTIEEHRRILDSLLAGDKASALEVLRTHLTERYLIPLCAV
jgi:DNA-binding GntR family transcriptional regulator